MQSCSALETSSENIKTPKTFEW